MHSEMLMQKISKELRTLLQGERQTLSLLLCVSAGVDSMVLLDVLHRVTQMQEFSGNIKIGVFHLNHKIREDSRLDGELIAKYCEEREIPFFKYERDMLSLAKEAKIGVEIASRNFRYNAAFHILLKEGFDYLLTAHHLDDQAETVFMNMARGAGLKGLCAMSLLKHRIYRPLLECSKKELMEYAKAQEIAFREDETNAENAYTRNKVRNQIFPYINDILNVDFPKKLSAMSSLLQPQYSAKQAEVSECFKQGIVYVKNLWEFKNQNRLITRIEPIRMQECDQGLDENWARSAHGFRCLSAELYDLSGISMSLDRGVFRGFAPQIRSEILYRIFEIFNAHVVDIDRKNIEILDEFLLHAESGKFRRYKGLVFESAAQTCNIMHESEYEALTSDYEQVLKTGENKIPHCDYMLDVEYIEGRENVRDAILREAKANDTMFLNANMFEALARGEIKLRNRREGDFIQPLDMHHNAKKIKKMMNEWKLHSHQKKLQPLVCIENSVLWMIGRRKSKFHIFDINHENIIRLKLHIV